MLTFMKFVSAISLSALVIVIMFVRLALLLPKIRPGRAHGAGLYKAELLSNPVMWILLLVIWVGIFGLSKLFG